jgi:hydrogenase nickel incorporation protein HypA/HybF
MHEASIVASVIAAISERLPGTPISLVRLEIGEMSGVLPDAIRFCFDLAASGTPVEGAELEIVPVAAVCVCRGCGAGFRPVDGLRLCPCGGADVVVVSGEELRIAAVGVRVGERV